MPRMFHVSSALNRASIEVHGLDWSRMGAAPGIAGSPVPEVAGVFLCPDVFTAEFFVRMNNTGAPVDVWAVDGVDASELIASGRGYDYLPHRVEPHRLTRLDVVPRPTPPAANGSDCAYRSTLTVRYDDGRPDDQP